MAGAARSFGVALLGLGRSGIAKKKQLLNLTDYMQVTCLEWLLNLLVTFYCVFCIERNVRVSSFSKAQLEW